MSNPWFRFYTEAVDDEKLRLIAFEDRWHFVAILCCKGSGLLDSDCSHDMLMRKVSVKLGLSTRELEEVARRLSEVDLIERDTLQPLRWDERQFTSDSSAERVRKYRERLKKSKVKRPCNVTVTAQDTDTDTDTDTEKKKVEARATRLARDWVPSALTDYFVQKHEISQDLFEREFEKFQNYWASKAGADGRKLDWDATWRNWLIRSRESRGGFARPPSNNKQAQDKIMEYLLTGDDE